MAIGQAYLYYFSTGNPLNAGSTMNCRACGVELSPDAVFCQRCGTPAGSAPVIYPLGGLASALAVLLALSAAASLGSTVVPDLGLVMTLLFLPLIPVFIVWFYRARKNADGRGWCQRRRAGWAIGAWFVPVIFLWFPYQIMADIWRAGLPADQRTRPAWLPITWWACWLLAWFTGFRYVRTNTATLHSVNFDLYLGSTVLSKLFLAAAAVAAFVVVRTVSSGEVGRDRQPYQPQQAPPGWRPEFPA
jgi:hypothetical protein